MIHLNYIFPMRLSKVEISLLVVSYEKKKTAENLRDFYDAERKIVFHTISI